MTVFAWAAAGADSATVTAARNVSLRVVFMRSPNEGQLLDDRLLDPAGLGRDADRQALVRGGAQGAQPHNRDRDRQRLLLAGVDGVRERADGARGALDDRLQRDGALGGGVLRADGLEVDERDAVGVDPDPRLEELDGQRRGGLEGL